MANFATVADLELVIQQEFALLTVSAAIRNYCRQQFDLVEDDEIVLDALSRTQLIYLPEMPVVEVSAVVENGVSLIVTDDYLLLRSGGLYRVRRPWYFGLQTLAVTYTHGYAEDAIPDDLMTVTARAASRLYQAGLRAADSAGVPGVVSKTLGDFSVTFGGESVVEGTMGASGARVLLLSEKDLLNKYRL
jgi:hypothetical protein